jgi:hypothetical protein
MSDVMIHVDPYAVEEDEAYHDLTESHDPIPELLTG